ncbi:MAG: type IV pili twitching motility protein PilT [Elusimicrobia bacterium CG08_land_8_20_14_0_20_59_10]|nr:MAG: type IV pili twitching motility protein PilT [Elusimicrobia bacterium CG08_land_8_20_14_0_20_59_10]
MAITEYELSVLLASVASYGGSDVHLMHGIPPIARIAGVIKALPFPPLSSETIQKLLDPYMTEAQREVYEKDSRVNSGHTIGASRYRFNIYKALGTVGASIRILPQKTYPLSVLGLPPIVGTLAVRKSGIIFVTGATGSGKSTTMAAMLDCINKDGRPSKIITIEDPVETIFNPCHSVFVQREVGTDTPSFAMGIMDSIRQDPDVLCIGELRDERSIHAAMVAAETGHLVLTTLHTRDAATTAQRLVSAVPALEQEILRDQLASCLEAVISQELLPRADGKGVVVACEILVSTPAVRQMIRENKLDAINDVIQSGIKHGMISKDISIKNLFSKGVITRETALEHMRHPEALTSTYTGQAS